MQQDPLYFHLIATHGPKWLLMAIVATVLLVSWRRAGLDQQAWRLGIAGLSLYIAVVLISPLLYGVLSGLGTGVVTDSEIWYALVGGLLTVLEFAGLLLIGLAVAAARREPR